MLFEVQLRAKPFSVSEALAAHVIIPLPGRQAGRVPPQKKKVESYYLFGSQLTSMHKFTSDPNRLEWNELIMLTTSFHSNRSNEVENS